MVKIQNTDGIEVSLEKAPEAPGTITYPNHFPSCGNGSAWSQSLCPKSSTVPRHATNLLWTNSVCACFGALPPFFRRTPRRATTATLTSHQRVAPLGDLFSRRNGTITSSAPISRGNWAMARSIDSKAKDFACVNESSSALRLSMALWPASATQFQIVSLHTLTEISWSSSACAVSYGTKTANKQAGV